jgi:hypothetical protein
LFWLKIFILEGYQMSMGKVSSNMSSMPQPVKQRTQAAPVNGDGINDVKKSPPSPPVKPMGKVGTIINIKA